MTNKLSSRLVLGAALAIAAFGVPAALATGAPETSAPLAACTSGEEEDTFTTNCTPFMVPNSPFAVTTNAANPDVPEIAGVPLTGANSGTAIGLEEEAAAEGPPAIPRSSFSSSP